MNSQQKDTEDQSLVRLILRLRRHTYRPPAECKTLLEPLTQVQRVGYVERIEAAGASLSPFFDPIELGLSVGLQLSALRAEARLLHAEGAFGSGRGVSLRINGWIKVEMKARHGVEWKTPGEMNPGIAY